GAPGTFSSGNPDLNQGRRASGPRRACTYVHLPRPAGSGFALALGLQDRPGAGVRAAIAGPDPLHLRRVRLRQGDAVVVKQLLAGFDVGDRLDEHLVEAAVIAVMLDQQRFAVRLAAVVDPARDPALHVAVNDVLVVEGKKERVPGRSITGVAGVDLGVGAAGAGVFDDALALGDGRHGEDAIAVDGGVTGDDLAGHAAVPVRGIPHCAADAERTAWKRTQQSVQ